MKQIKVLYQVNQAGYTFIVEFDKTFNNKKPYSFRIHTAWKTAQSRSFPIISDKYAYYMECYLEGFRIYKAFVDTWKLQNQRPKN